jgi:sugar/nucleoside kinase (ribokinase family)
LDFPIIREDKRRETIFVKVRPLFDPFDELCVIFLFRLPEIVYLSPRPPKADSELHQLARAGDAAALRAFLHTHGSEGIDEQNAGKWGGWSFNINVA